MKIIELFEKQELELIQGVMKEIRESWNFPETIDLDWLVHDWENFVKEVEAGYDDILSEYSCSLAHREELEKIIIALEKKGCHKLRLLVNPFDERFKFSTRKGKENIVDTELQHCKTLFNRVPLLMNGPMMEELEKT